MFDYIFMQHALIAILLAGFMGGSIGYFILLRKLTFAAHGLGHVSFSGAAFAVCFNFSPIWGQFLATLGTALLIGCLKDTWQKREVSIAMALAFMLGLGILFLNYSNSSTNMATRLLFGDVLSVSHHALIWMELATLGTSLLFAFLLRPLLFSSLYPQWAESLKLPVKTLDILFLVFMALGVTLVNQVVGALLVFVLLIGPAAISMNITKNFWSGFITSILIAMISGWLSLCLSFYLNWPVSVCLTGLVFITYLGSLLKK